MRSSNNQNSRMDRDSQQNYQHQDFSRRDRGQFRDDSDSSSLNERDSSSAYGSQYGSDQDRGYGYSSNSSRNFSQASDEARYGSFQDHDSSHGSLQADRGYNNQMSQQTSMIGQQGYGSDEAFPGQHAHRSQGYSSQQLSQPSYRSQGYSSSQRNDWGSQPSYDSQKRWAAQDQSYGQGQYGQSYGQTQSQGRFSGLGPKGYKRSDERIKEDVCEALTHDSELDASNIDVEVKEGTITLSGTVDSRSIKHHAEICIERLSGVKDIINNLRVDTSSGINTNSSTKTDRYNGMSTSTSSTLASSGLSTTPTSKKSAQ
jgi:osmotically-inducible protein OsmY